MRWSVNPLGGEPQLESRMREIRQSGSEGGGAKPIASPYPYLYYGTTEPGFSCFAG